ncbi:MAG: ABC transporter ATP-binding protein [Schwartzia sp.]|nr:ABC transporter ATP-binding protein [Schwartzia sp. (in: firmicutes)]MBQ5413200.1 ABC transporter ATP-binding protein [Schwartzia sp. (in: firmicutes)]
MDIIRMEGITKGYPDHPVLNDLTLSIKKGECFTLLGPSGCGKTVLLRLIAGFESPETGKIFIDDIPVNDMEEGIDVPPENRGLGVVFQDYAVWPHMTVFENIAYPLKIANVPKDEIQQRVMEMVDIVGMKGLDKRYPSELSGGQQQRVALARALVGKPSLMLLDEPLSNLDANLREEMRFEIKELQRKLGVTVLYVTHDQEIGLAISDRVAIMDENGVIQQIGTPWEIFEQPANPFVFNFMGIANFIDVRRDGTNFFVGKGTQPMPWDEKPEGEAVDWVAAFRPSDVTISREDKGLHGIVRRANFLGAMMDYLIEIDGAFLRTSLETHHAIARDLILKAGDTINVQFLALHWFEKETLKGVRNE